MGRCKICCRIETSLGAHHFWHRRKKPILAAPHHHLLPKQNGEAILLLTTGNDTTSVPAESTVLIWADLGDTLGGCGEHCCPSPSTEPLQGGALFLVHDQMTAFAPVLRKFVPRCIGKFLLCCHHTYQETTVAMFSEVINQLLPLRRLFLEYCTHPLTPMIQPQAPRSEAVVRVLPKQRNQLRLGWAVHESGVHTLSTHY